MNYPQGYSYPVDILKKIIMGCGGKRGKNPNANSFIYNVTSVNRDNFVVLFTILVAFCAQ